MGRKEVKRDGRSSTSLLIIILMLLIIIAGVLFAMKIVKEEGEGKQASNSNTSTDNTPKETPKPKTFAGNERAMAFMIDNNINAMPQAGLLEADLVYEIIVEGGETRLMAVIKNKDIKQIGPLRSARHYFIDYALENDAIYVHYGQSPQAKTDIAKLGINDINGIYESESNFWRVTSRYAPHNAVTSTEKLQKIIKRENFRTTSNKGSVLNYVVEEVDLPEEKEQTGEEDAKTTIKNLASTVTIPYSAYNTVKYTYNEETKEYTRYSREKKQTDWNSEKTVTTKNIIITKCKNWSIDDYGRQTIDNVKKLEGYYITNGKYIPITCEKKQRDGKTVYKDLEGNEIKVNDGKTFIQIVPSNSKISFK